jgi:dihydroneopterin triphosphate diphosphatase
MPQIVSNIVDVYAFRRRGEAVEFLLLKRAAQEGLGGTWQAVHGGIEAGETAVQAGLRELHEETGLTPLRVWQLERVNTFYVARTDSILLCPGLAVEVGATAEVRLSAEHEEYRWEPSARAIDGVLWPGQREALREILTVILGPTPAARFLELPIEGRG